jgi:hypothetical protein
MKDIVDRLTDIGSVDCSELSRILPLVVRVIPELNDAIRELECQPNSGEYSRYGVFFHALADEEELKRFSDRNPKIVLSTSDLFARTGISGDLKQGGVLVFPSQRYQTEITRILNKNGLKDPKDLCFGNQIGIDRIVQEKHITLDVAGACQGRLPILSIPQRILIAMDLIKK